MAIDLEAIRRKVAELSGIRKTSSVQMWKADLGEHKVRLLPWKNATPDNPFLEKYFYYIGTNSGILTPHQFGKPDPIHELSRSLWASGKPDDRTLAKKLMPKRRSYSPLIVRGQEDKGVQVWSFGKIVYQRLLGFLLDEDLGDILDPQTGFDLKVTLSKQPGKQFNDTVVDCKPRSSKLHDDPKQALALLDAVPNLDDMYRLKTYEEIETILKNWMDTGGPESSDSNGTYSAGGSETKSDALDDLVKEVSTSSDSEDKPKKSKKTSDEVSSKKQSLDEAFSDLMKD
jgi:hypothetical protein